MQHPWDGALLFTKNHLIFTIILGAKTFKKVFLCYLTEFSNHEFSNHNRPLSSSKGVCLSICFGFGCDRVVNSPKNHNTPRFTFNTIGKLLDEVMCMFVIL